MFTVSTCRTLNIPQIGRPPNVSGDSRRTSAGARDNAHFQREVLRGVSLYQTRSLSPLLNVQEMCAEDGSPLSLVSSYCPW